jgi:phosphinothricin acetyltransferase
MRDEDWPRVVEIYCQGLSTGVSTLESEAPTFEAWNASHDKRCRLVAGEDGPVAGWVALTPVSGRRVYSGVAELSVYVAEECRGKKIGRSLLNALIDHSEKEGFWMLQASIQAENAASLTLHRRCGFRVVGLRERIGRDSKGIWRSIMLMERRSGKVGLD